MFFIPWRLYHGCGISFVRHWLNLMIIQIYEIQSSQEADAMLGLGVDHVGGVILNPSRSRDPLLRATVKSVQEGGAKSCLIPLFDDLDVIQESLNYYQPDIVHFCDTLVSDLDNLSMKRQIDRQVMIRQFFPRIKIMRSIPIGVPESSDRIPSLAWAACFEPWTDWFLTDTLLCTENMGDAVCNQPVDGFVGITGRTCDWGVAKELVRQSGIPVILAGGLGPDNVAQAIAQVHPAGVDSCTLTNASDASGHAIRFKKDLQKVALFMAQARRSAARNSSTIEYHI